MIRHTRMPYSKHCASKAVRALLLNSVAPLSLSPWVLDEKKYPFQLYPHELYVSFSHSDKVVGCAISDHPAIGLDIEIRPISPAIARRCFSLRENEALDHRYAENPVVVAQLCTRLWILKEAYIKASWQKQSTHLFAGLRTCMVNILGANALELYCNRWEFNGWHVHVDESIPLAAIYQTATTSSTELPMALN